ncbi:MAG TPA: hypothetical protein VIH59_11555 [Candidatus Tectomicrobia bacterium]|jgi:hypothetical protein
MTRLTAVVSMADPAESMLPGVEACFTQYPHEHPLITHYQRTQDGSVRQSGASLPWLRRGRSKA